MDIVIPNLQIMIHHYTCIEHLFTTVTMYADDERAQVCENIVKAKNWYWGRYAVDHRQDYLKKRLFVEARMHTEFSRKYWTPKIPCPVFFYLYPDLSLHAIEERLSQRQQYGEQQTKYLLIGIQDLVDTRHMSFTLCDSHRSYRKMLIQHGLSTDTPSTPQADHGTVFHIHELAEVYARNQEEDGLYFEVQVWDPEILTLWKEAHGVP